MLILTRKEGESLYLTLTNDIDPKTPIGEVLGSEPIVLRIRRLNAKSVRVGVDAPDGVLVLRDELVGD
jgi:sRNA-binding carbon storage regulator CsrA